MTTIIRPPKPTDISFIYKTWLDSYRYDSAIGKQCKNSVFYDNYKLVIDRILKDNSVTVSILCLEDSQDTILGYSVMTAIAIHYVYVKQAFRKLGLGRKLVGGLPTPRSVVSSPQKPSLHPLQPQDSSGPSGGMIDRVICTHKTFSSLPIFAKYPELLYNPFELYSIGDNNNE